MDCVPLLLYFSKKKKEEILKIIDVSEVEESLVEVIDAYIDIFYYIADSLWRHGGGITYNNDCYLMVREFTSVIADTNTITDFTTAEKEFLLKMVLSEMQELYSAQGKNIYDIEFQDPMFFNFKHSLIATMENVLKMIVKMGLNPIFTTCFKEVHRANMAKFKNGVNIREDGKILKPEGWTPPNILRILVDKGLVLQ